MASAKAKLGAGSDSDDGGFEKQYPSIYNYLEPEHIELFRKVIRILTHISEVTDATPYIYGGFLRDIIRLKYNHKVGLTQSHIVPYDVDVFLAFNCDASLVSIEYWTKLTKSLISQLQKKYKIYNPHMDTDDAVKFSSYSFKCEIDNIRFDFSTHINELSFEDSRFNHMIDYTVNNLCINLAGILSLRVHCGYQYGGEYGEECFDDSSIRKKDIGNVIYVIEDHIRYKKMICVSKPIICDTKLHAIQMENRRAKMIGYGYHIPSAKHHGSTA